MAPPTQWKPALAIALAAAIVLSACARAPGKPLPRAELRWLLLSALGLYTVGFVALFEHHSALAALVFAAGVATSALAAWLSRGGAGGGDPPRDDEPADEEPPPGPEGAPRFDWTKFERELLAYTDRLRDPVQ